MKKYAIIVAGGSGTRMGTALPKQFIELNKKPVLMHTISRFFDFDNSMEMIVVLPETQISVWQQLCMSHHFTIPHTIIKGGKERFYSVKNGINSIHGEGLVAIHDGVRPLVYNSTIKAAFESAVQFGNGIPSINLTDSIRKLESGTNKTQNRADFRLIQTPQCFKLSLIKVAFEQSYNELFSDDASVLEAAGYQLFLTEGNKENIKITTPFDLKIAEIFLNFKSL